MTYRFRLILIIPLVIFSVTFTTWTSAQNYYKLTLGSLLIFSLLIIGFSDGINPPTEPKSFFHRKYIPPQSMYWNTLLSLIVYAWGALCFLCVYIFSGLVWLHGIQYGIAAALISLFLFLFWYRSDWNLAKLSQKRVLASLHGVSLVVGLTYLIIAGKLSTVRGDWAANYIFLSGGITLLLLCLLTLWGDKKWNSAVKN